MTIENNLSENFLGLGSQQNWVLPRREGTANKSRLAGTSPIPENSHDLAAILVSIRLKAPPPAYIEVNNKNPKIR